MNIKLSSVPSIDEQPTAINTVDTVFVNRLINGMIRIPIEIRLRFKTINTAPAITVTLTYKTQKGRPIKEQLTTITNGELINAVIAAMGSNLKPIQEFQTNGDNTVEDSSENFELEMFKTFIRSQHRLTLEDDFISPHGDRFLHAVFSIGYHKDIHFYLKRDEHIEKLLNEALTSQVN